MNDHRMDDLLSRHRLGELSPRQERDVLEFLSTQEGKRRLEEQEAEDERILKELPPHRMAEEIRRRADRSRRDEPSTRHRPAVGWFAGSGLAVALGCLAIAISLRNTTPSPTAETAPVSLRTETNPGTASPISAPSPAGRQAATHGEPTAPATEIALAPAPAPDDGLRTKGEIRRLRVHCVSAPNGVAVPLADGDGARPGDLLQVSLLAGPATFAAVLSLDGTGHVTRHIPETGDSSVAVRDAREAPHSFQLDSTPGFERFVLVQSDRPFPLRTAESILGRAGARAPLAVPGGWTVQSILVAKPEPRP